MIEEIRWGCEGREGGRTGIREEESLHLSFTLLLKSSQAAASEEEWKKTMALRQKEREGWWEKACEFDKY